MDRPIVGFNVNEEITRNSVGGASAGAQESVVDLLNSSLPDVERGKVEALVQLIKTENSTMLSTVKSRKQDTVIPQGQTVVVSCRATLGPIGKISVLYEFDADPSYPTDLQIPETQLTVAGGSPCRVNNPTRHDITLRGRTVLGYLQQVKSVTPLKVKLKGSSSSTTVNSAKANIQEQRVNEVSYNSCLEWSKGEAEFNISENQYDHIPDVDIEGLSEERRTIARKMLEEEAESFSKTDDDVAAAEEFQVEINLTDSVPV